MNIFKKLPGLVPNQVGLVCIDIRSNPVKFWVSRTSRTTIRGYIQRGLRVSRFFQIETIVGQRLFTQCAQVSRSWKRYAKRSWNSRVIKNFVKLVMQNWLGRYVTRHLNMTRLANEAVNEAPIVHIACHVISSLGYPITRSHSMNYCFMWYVSYLGHVSS